LYIIYNCIIGGVEMGCCNSCLENFRDNDDRDSESDTLLPRRGKPWVSEVILTVEELKKMREDFWFSTKGTEGRELIWDTLRVAVEEKDDILSQAILEAAGIVLEKGSIQVTYDPKGMKYELPNYVLQDPTNLQE